MMAHYLSAKLVRRWEDEVMEESTQYDIAVVSDGDGNGTYSPTEAGMPWNHYAVMCGMVHPDYSDLHMTHAQHIVALEKEIAALRAQVDAVPVDSIRFIINRSGSNQPLRGVAAEWAHSIVQIRKWLTVSP